MWQRIKYFVYAGLAMFLIYNMCFKKEEMVEVPTQGLITTVKEIEKDQFKIEDEIPVSNPDSSLIVAKYLDNRIDTFTLNEARLMESQGYSGFGTTGAIMQAASFGFLGYMLGRSMMSRPSAGAYVNQSTYDRVNNTTGSTLRSTASRTPKGRTGFGSGRSTRSFGG